MRTSKFTVEQIAHALRRAAGGVAVAEICRELGIMETPFYRWKRKYHGLGNPEIRELRQLRDEHRKLKLAVADLILDRTMLQDAMQIELLKPAAKRTLAAGYVPGEPAPGLRDVRRRTL